MWWWSKFHGVDLQTKGGYAYAEKGDDGYGSRSASRS